MMNNKTEIIKEFVQAMLDAHPKRDGYAQWIELLQQRSRITKIKSGDVLVKHHAIADDLHFLVEGTLHYKHLVSDDEEGETISHHEIPWMPIGWSSFNFRRYRVTIVGESDGLLLTLPLAAWQELAAKFPSLWAELSEFMFRISIQLLWVARGLSQDAYADVVPSNVTSPLVPQLVANPEPSSLLEIYQQSDCFSSLSVACRQWMAENSQLFQTIGKAVVISEGEASDGLWLLKSGRVKLRFTMVSQKGEQTAVRTVVRPGTLLCWSAIDSSVPAPYQIETTRNTTLAFLPRSALSTLFGERPEWVGAIFEQQIWQLRRYLRTTRTRYAEAPDDGGIGLLSNLIEDSKPILPVNSILYGVPYLLNNRLTRHEGFERVYRAHYTGTESERAIASLALDILREFERAHRFDVSVLSTYAAVIRNEHLPPAMLRKVVTRHFRDALAHVPYVIKGWENLPDDPNCIFIYNHMAYGDDAELPNGFFFNPDSHFLSAMILEPKYGDGIRVSRTNDRTEFWREDYYSRLGHISVATPESGWLNETKEEKQQRKEKFFADCQAVLASGQPFIIAPEGTITEEESVTERSPGPLRPGAFLMSGRFPSKPKIVPVAFANFDKPIYKTIFSCVIKPAFSIEERGVDVNDRASLGQFLRSYRQEFRGYVEEAIELARQVEEPEADLTGIITNLDQVGTVSEEFELDVRALEQRLTLFGTDLPATVFYGSSTIRLWDSLREDMGIPNAVNLGFGGSTLEACRIYFERLLLPFEPQRAIIYAGENDIGVGASAEFVTEQFRQFADMIESYLPTTRCWFISIKPSPARLVYLEEIKQANTNILAEIEQREQWQYVDFFRYLVDRHGEPCPHLYSPDQLHLNLAGYGILAKLLRQELHH